MQGMGLRPCAVKLPANTHPPLGPSVAGEFTGDKSRDVVYLDRAGRLVSSGGVTAKAFGAIVITDNLFWNAAEYLPLDGGDRIDLFYDA